MVADTSAEASTLDNNSAFTMAKANKESKLQRISNFVHGRKKQQDPHSQKAINKALIKQYGQPPSWAATSNMQYSKGLKGGPRRMLAGAGALGDIAGAAGGGGGGSGG